MLVYLIDDYLIWKIDFKFCLVVSQISLLTSIISTNYNNFRGIYTSYSRYLNYKLGIYSIKFQFNFEQNFKWTTLNL